MDHKGTSGTEKEGHMSEETEIEHGIKSASKSRASAQELADYLSREGGSEKFILAQIEEIISESASEMKAAMIARVRSLADSNSSEKRLKSNE